MCDTTPVRRVIRFYRNGNGTMIAKEEFFDLPEAGQAALAELFKRYERGNERPKEVRPLGNGLFEMRTSVESMQYRAFFFRDGVRFAIVVLCMQKDQRKARKSDIDLARRRMSAWKARGVEVKHRPSSG